MGLGSNGVLRVRLSHALGLRSMDRNGFSDPYVKLTVGKKTVKSKTIRRTLNPRWDQDFEFRGKLGELVAEPMLVSAWDYDFASRDDPLGDARVDLSQLEHMPQLECIVKLKDQQAKPGEVFLSFNWQADGSSSSQWPNHQQAQHHQMTSHQHLPLSPQRLPCPPVRPSSSPQPCALLPSSHACARSPGFGQTYGTPCDGGDTLHRGIPLATPARPSSDMPLVAPPRRFSREVLASTLPSGSYQGSGKLDWASRYGGHQTSSATRTAGLMYVLDVGFRAVVTACTTSAIVAPQQLVGTADTLRTAVSSLVKESFATGAIWVAVSFLSVVLVVVVGWYYRREGCHSCCLVCQPRKRHAIAYGQYGRSALRRGYSFDANSPMKKGWQRMDDQSYYP